MNTYQVVCTGRVTETYYVDAESESEAMQNWHEGELVNSETWDCGPDSARLLTEDD